MRRSMSLVDVPETLVLSMGTWGMGEDFSWPSMEVVNPYALAMFGRVHVPVFRRIQQVLLHVTVLRSDKLSVGLYRTSGLDCIESPGDAVALTHMMVQGPGEYLLAKAVPVDPVLQAGDYLYAQCIKPTSRNLEAFGVTVEVKGSL